MSDNDKKAQEELVKALEACSILETLDGRNKCKQRLPEDIGRKIPDEGEQRVHLTTFVEKCLDFDAGIERLVEAVYYYEGDNKPMKRVRECADKLIRPIRPDPSLTKEDKELLFLEAMREALIQLKPDDHAEIRTEIKDFIDGEIKLKEYRKRRDFFELFEAKARKWELGHIKAAAELCDTLIREYDRCVKPLPYACYSPPGLPKEISAEGLAASVTEVSKSATSISVSIERDQDNFEKRRKISDTRLPEPLEEDRRCFSPDDIVDVLAGLLRYPQYIKEVRLLEKLLKRPGGFIKEDFTNLLLRIGSDEDDASLETEIQNTAIHFGAKWENAEKVKPIKSQNVIFLRKASSNG